MTGQFGKRGVVKAAPRAVAAAAPAMPQMRAQRFETALRILYAATLTEQGRIPEARDVAAPACRDSEESPSLINTLNYLRSAKICTD